MEKLTPHFQQTMNQTLKAPLRNTTEDATPIRMKAVAVKGNIIHILVTKNGPKYKAHSLIKRLMNIT